MTTKETDLRDRFAEVAMIEMLNSKLSRYKGVADIQNLTEDSYLIANAMMKERKK